MIRLGIIGTDCARFTERYLPLFEQLRSRVQVVSVYDPVLVHARQVASHFDAQVSYSFQRLVDRPDIHGLLMLSPAWADSLPVSQAMLQNKPLFCSQFVWKNMTEKKHLEAVFQETGATVVIESQCRYWPSILRARELQATELGMPCELIWQINRQFFQNPDTLNETISEVLDGICFLLQRFHIRLNKKFQTDCAPDPREFHLGLLFDKPQHAENPESIPVTVLRSRTSSCPLLQIRCERGTLEITSPIEMSWQVGEQSHHNLLSDDQPGTARQIDHFFRHIAGGLIPLHNLTNALWNDHQSKWLQKLLDVT